MRGDPLASGKYLDGTAGEPDLDLGAGEAMRHAVIMLVDIDVIIDPDTTGAPFGEHVGLDWQWFERGLVEFFERLAPENASWYRHTVEGPDDMPAHIRAALTPTQLSIPLVNGRLALGTWQGIYLFEHRSGPHRRSIVLHLVGE